MCGIAGSTGNTLPSGEQIKLALEKLRHRGPDRQNFETIVHGTRATSLLHARLSIIDCAARADQPFRWGSFVLAYNGEIYNYLELRAELVAAGHKFETSSDTEVLLRLLAVHGPEGLAACEGMWALALYNQEDGSLLLSRDRFGEKPLYIHEAQGTLYFASELKALAALSGRRFTPNDQQLYRYLFLGYRSLFKKPECFFDGVSQIEPGSVVRIDANGNRKVSHYWRRPEIRPAPMTYPEAVSKVRTCMDNAVLKALRADVPIAFCLSGGVDSTALVSIAKRVLKADVHGFTVANTDQRYREIEMVERSVAELGIKHTFVPVESRDFLSRLRSLILMHDAPIATVTYYVQWRMMQRIAEAGYKVVISGTGADEIFSGYYDHHLAYFFDMQSNPSAYENSVAHWKEKILPLIRNPRFQNPRLFIEDPAARDFLYGERALADTFAIRPWWEEFREESFGGGLLRSRMQNELYYESVPLFLNQDDLNGMSFSLENRSPYVNHHLVELCASIPTEHLIHHGYAKALLRDSVRDIAPAHIIDCIEKVGFNAPLSELLDLNDPSVVEYLVDEGPIYRHIKREAVEKLVRQPSEAFKKSSFLFSFVNAKIFLEEFGR